MGKTSRLVQHTTGITAVQGRDMCRQIALRKVESLWLIALKTAIYVHTVMHRESTDGHRVTIIDTLGNPNIGVVHFSKTQGKIEITGGIIPTAAVVSATAVLGDVDDIAVCG